MLQLWAVKRSDLSSPILSNILVMKVVVTDKAEFVPLLEHNIELNQDVLSCSNVSALPLTWGSREEVSVSQ